MAHKEIWTDWKRLRFLPFIWTRTIAWCMDTAPGIPVDISTLGTEYKISLHRPSPEEEKLRLGG